LQGVMIRQKGNFFKNVTCPTSSSRLEGLFQDLGGLTQATISTTYHAEDVNRRAAGSESKKLVQKILKRGF